MSSVPARAERKALETVHARANAHVRTVSPDKAWDGIAVSRFRLGQIDVSLPPLHVPAFGVNYGEALRLERTLHGRRISGSVMPGHLAILPPDANTRWVFNKTAEVVLVYVSRSLFDQAIEHGFDRDRRLVEVVPRFLIRDIALERAAHQLLLEIAKPRPESRLAAEALGLDLARHILVAHSNLPGPEARPHSIAPSRLKRAHEFMLANLGCPVSLQEMAAAAGMSLFHFARGFREATQRPPHRYLTEQRLLKARTLLHDRKRPIGEIARAIGYTPSHFAAVFTRHVGMTPSRFREVLDG